MRGELGVRQALVERERDRLLGPGVERVDAVAHRARLGAREEHLGGRHGFGRQVVFGGVIVVGGQRHGIDFPPAQLIEAAVADDGREPRHGLALRDLVRASVVPDVDVRLLQDLLRGGGVFQDTQRDAV